MSFFPNTTPTPNWLYNGEMRKMNETELKVVLLVTRKTLGWFDPMTQERKTQDYISQSQFMEFTGQSHTAIASAIQVAVENGWIIARNRKGEICNTSDKRRRNKILYQLGNVFTNKISKQQSGLDKNLSNNVAQSKQHLDTNLSNKVDNTKETLTKETNTKEERALLLKEEFLEKENKQIAEITFHYTSKINNKARLLDKAKDKIQARLKSFSKEEIKKAIDNFSCDDWKMKNLSDKGIAWFFHSDERIEQYINLTPKKKQLTNASMSGEIPL